MCVGCSDDTRIPIITPSENESYYCMDKIYAITTTITVKQTQIIHSLFGNLYSLQKNNYYFPSWILILVLWPSPLHLSVLLVQVISIFNESLPE